MKLIEILSLEYSYLMLANVNIFSWEHSKALLTLNPTTSFRQSAKRVTLQWLNFSSSRV